MWHNELKKTCWWNAKDTGPVSAKNRSTYLFLTTCIRRSEKRVPYFYSRRRYFTHVKLSRNIIRTHGTTSDCLRKPNRWVIILWQSSATALLCSRKTETTMACHSCVIFFFFFLSRNCYDIPYTSETKIIKNKVGKDWKLRYDYRSYSSLTCSYLSLITRHCEIYVTYFCCLYNNTWFL